MKMKVKKIKLRFFSYAGLGKANRENRISYAGLGKANREKKYQRGRSRFEKIEKISPNNPVFLGKNSLIFLHFHFN